MSTKASKRVKSREVAPTSRVMAGKQTRKAEQPAQVKAKSEADWLAQEAAELPPTQRVHDPVSDALGRDIYMPGTRRSDWRDKRDIPFFVRRLYAGLPQVIFDMPATEEESTMKKDFFKDTEYIYLAVEPNESLEPQHLRDRFLNLVREKKAAVKAA